MKNLKLLVCLAVLAGCSSAGQMPPMAQFDTDVDQPYPPLTLYTKEPSSDFHARCADYEAQTFKQCIIKRAQLGRLREALRQPGLFEQLGVGRDENHDYTASIAMALYDATEASEGASAFFAGLTLFLVPFKGQQVVEAEIDLRWRGQLLKQYSLQLPITYSVSLFDGGSPAKHDQMIAEYLAAAFIREYQLDGVHTGEFLLDRLGASDYAADLAHPEQALDYHYEGRHVYPDPFLGVQLRYQHTLFGDSVDVYVYPVKGAKWSDTGKALAAEMDLLQREYSLLGKRGLYASLELPEQAEAAPAPAGAGVAEGLRLDFTFTGPNDAKMLSQVRLFLKKDKLVKFRKTGPALDIKHDLDEFVAALLPLLDPPDESLFMEEMRLNIQKQAIFTEE